MGIQNLSILILQKIGIRPMQRTWCTCTYTCRVHSWLHTPTTRLNPNKSYFFIIKKRMKYSDSIAPAADASNNVIWKPSFFNDNLSSCLLSYHLLEISDH